MAKSFKPGSFVNYSNGFEGRISAYDVENNGVEKLDNWNGKVLSTYTNIVAIPNIPKFVISSDKESQVRIHSLDGTVVQLPTTSGNNSACGDCAVSADGTTLAMLSVSTDHVTVYDIATETEIGYYPVPFALGTANPTIALSEDGAYVLAGAWNSKVAVLDTSDGSTLFQSAGVIFIAGAGWNKHDNTFLAKDTTGIFYVIDSATWALGTNVTTTGSVGGTAHGVAVSPNGNTVLTWSGSANDICAMDLATMTVNATMPTSGGTYAHYFWKDDSTVYRFTGTPQEYHEISFDGTTFGSLVLKGKTHQDGVHLGAFVNGSEWIVSDSIIDQSAEEGHVAIAMSSDGETVLGRTIIPEGQSDFVIPVPNDEHCMVIVSGSTRIRHSNSTAYLLGDRIFTQDTDMIYECTNPGTTDSIKPAYPTTGTIVDGTATFEAKGKRCKAVANYPVSPVPRPSDAAPLVTMNIHAGTSSYSPVNLTIGDTWTDPSATAVDFGGGDITGSIVVSGDTVDTAVAGTYNVIYTAVDSNTVYGKATRSIIVV